MFKKLPLLFLFTILLNVVLFGQTGVVVEGRILLSSGEPAVYSNVYIEEIKKGCVSDLNGKFSIPNVPIGAYTLKVSTIEAAPYEQKITIGATNLQLNISLKDTEGTKLAAVTVVGKSALTKVRETGYNVTAIDATQSYNTTKNVVDLLNTASGVRVREQGGVGSDYTINLNGFTGRQVKTFVDGVPMEGFGSAYNINNLPATLIDRIEIYKGVVPIELGSDALGGAINIITRKIGSNKNTYLDASTSYGSFSTVRSNLNFGHTTKKGYTIQVSGVQNYSKNDYKVYEVVTDLDNFSVSPNKEWNRRFNDKYRNETLTLKTGFTNQKWADKFLVGIMVGQDLKGIQTNYRQRVVFGKRAQKGRTIMPSVEYSKRNLFVDGLDLRVVANMNINLNQIIDTSKYWFNWRGESRISGRSGESGMRSLNKFFNDNLTGIAGLNYVTPNRKHKFNYQTTYTAFRRRTADSEMVKDPLTGSENYKRTNSKIVSGLSYGFDNLKNWNVLAFGKQYAQWASGPTNVSTNINTSAVWELQSRKSNNFGYGLTTTFLLKEFQFKTSYEKSYRMPGSTELFGDGINIDNATSLLRPESSHNINFNFSYTTDARKESKHKFFGDVGVIYRNTKDFIIQSIGGQGVTTGTNGFAKFMNWGNVLTYGVNAELRYYYGRLFSVGSSLTYQDSRDQQEISTITGRKSLSYKIRVPNIPYFYSNSNVEFYFHDLIWKNTMLTVNYGLNFVEEYSFDWENLGTPFFRPFIPRQLSHDISLAYSLQNGKYNIMLEALNVSDALLYDNFSLQKPSRSFNVKLRYYFNKNS